MHILLFIALIIGIIYGPGFWAQRILKKYNQSQYFSGNGYDLARILLDNSGLNHIRIEESPTGDHYDPVEKVVRLNPSSCGKNTLTAAVVAAHEVGHAIQDASEYKLLQLRTHLVLFANTAEKIGAGLMIAVPIVTAIAKVPAAGLLILLGGGISLIMPVAVHLITLPVEFDASFNRALPILKHGNYLPEEDIDAARSILTACALTYAAGALASLLNIWRWLRLLRR